jgi:hypothetical protein
MSGIPAQHDRPSLAEQPLHASSGARYAEVFVRPRAEMGVIEIYVLRWRDAPGGDDLAQPIREALTRDHGWAEVAPGSEAHRYDSIVAGRAGVTVDIDLLAGVLERARAQIDSLAGTVTYPIVGETLVPAEITDRIRADLEAPRVIDGLLEHGEIVVGPEAGVVHYHHDGASPALPTERLDAPFDVVRPAGLTWSGIRVDELERVGYEIVQPSAASECPPLEDGEIYGVPEHGVIYVWSRADFDRLAELSRRLHDARRAGELDTGALLLDAERDAGRLADAGALSIEVLRALPPAG